MPEAAATPIQHPAPRRHRVGWLRALIGFLGAPTAWAGQMISSEILSSYACYPHRAPLFIQQWPWLQIALAAVCFASFSLAILCSYIAWISWQRTRHETVEGRTRFVALFSLYSSGLFMTAIIFTTFGLLLVSPC